MSDEPRSLCPINLSLEVFGDKWTLLIVRDIMFGGKRHFRELLQSDEHIASNVLADRLSKLVAEGIITKSDDPSHKQKAIYSLTEKGLELLPILAQIGLWGRKYLPVSPELGWRPVFLSRGGPALLDRFAAELRAVHLAPPGTAPSPEDMPVTTILRSSRTAPPPWRNDDPPPPKPRTRRRKTR
ncbi:winged helix-turn-helix transcriptional regulator [Pendulispora albinea]|uniref:Helix-turn-helix transcriptional regulator n=1 Tax=Pendulispora albinea TaxID=2741071 RepID=A0ABZ2M144_9BACT